LTRAILAPTAAAFLVVAFIIVANEMKQQMSRFLIQFLTARDLATLGAALLPSLLPMILPAALFFGVLMGYGRLAERGEITAMRAAGVSLSRVVAPAFIVGLVATAGTMVVQDLLLPHTMNYARHLLRVELPRRATLDTISPGVMHSLGDWRVYFKGRDRHSHTLRDVVVVSREEGRGGAVVYNAEFATASIDESGSTLLLGPGYSVSPDGLRASCESVLLHLPGPASELKNNPTLATSTLAELIAQERSLSEEFSRADSLSIEKRLRRLRSALAERISLPFAAVLFAAIAAPLAVESARYRRGGRQRLLVTGLIPVFGYYFLHVALQSNSLQPLASTLLLAWMPNLLLAACAAGLFARALRVH